MDRFADELNAILIEAYHNILRLEEEALRKANKISLSINEMHLIECVGKGKEGGRSISELANDLNITRPSATIAVNKLESKGFVKKMNCETDGRVVRVFLTHEGEKIDTYHRIYHRRMVKEISDGFSEEEKDCLIKAIRKLNGFFKNSIGETV